jgi:hypothetical protein
MGVFLKTYLFGSRGPHSMVGVIKHHHPSPKNVDVSNADKTILNKILLKAQRGIITSYPLLTYIFCILSTLPQEQIISVVEQILSRIENDFFQVHKNYPDRFFNIDITSIKKFLCVHC